MKVIMIPFIILILSTGCSILSLHNNETKDNMYLLTNDSIKYWGDVWKVPYFDTTLYIYKCGYTHIFKIMKLSTDSMELKEITPYGFFPDFGMPIGTTPILYIGSKDQYTRPTKDYQNYNNGPVKAYPILH